MFRLRFLFLNGTTVLFVCIFAFTLGKRLIPPKIYLTSGHNYVWYSEKLIYFKTIESAKLTFTCNSSLPIDWDFYSPQNKISKVKTFTRERLVNHTPSDHSENVFEITVTIKTDDVLVDGMYICKSLMDRAFEDSVFLFIDGPGDHYVVEEMREIRPRLDDEYILLPCTFPYFKPTVPPTLYRIVPNLSTTLISNETYVTYDSTNGFYLWANKTRKNFVHRETRSSFTTYQCVHNYKEDVNVYVYMKLYEPLELIFSPESYEFHGQQIVSCASKYPIILYDEEWNPLPNALYFLNSSSPYLHNAEAVISEDTSCSTSTAHSLAKTWNLVAADLNIEAYLDGDAELKCPDTNLTTERRAFIQKGELNTYRCNEPAECNFLRNQLIRFTKNDRAGTYPDIYSQYTISARPVAAQCSMRGMLTSSPIYTFILELDRHFFQLNDSVNDFKAHRLVKIESSSKVAYLGEHIRFTCVAVRFLFANVHWVLHYMNGSSFFRTTEEGDSKNMESVDKLEFRGIIQQRSTTFQINDPDILFVSCYAPFWNSLDWANATQSIDVKARVPPEIVGAANIEDTVIQPNVEEIRLPCDVSGHPKPTINWTGNFIEGIDARIETTISDKNIISVLVLFGEITQREEDFLCTATNIFGPTMKRFKTVTSKAVHPGIIAAVVASILLVGIAISVLLWRQHRKVIRMRHLLTEKDIKDFLEGSPDSKGIDTDPLSSAFPEMFKVNPDYFVYDNMLGYGAYGIVYSGVYRHKNTDEYNGNTVEQKVAVKTVQQGADVHFVRSLLAEIKSMVYVGSHEHIVKFIGACIQNIRYNEIYILLEFCDGGCLQSFLRDHREEFRDLKSSELQEGNADSGSGQKTDTITTSTLLLWSRQISSAMQHLTKKKLIHGDLAARNVLLMEDLTAKVSDFGLAKQLYNYTEYKRVGQNLLPWAWMAVESLRDKAFSIQSDVWSFGVTLWEIFSLGQVPYGGLGFTMEFINMLELGLRLPKPAHASDLVYEIMTECWNISPTQRPTFAILESMLSFMSKSSAAKAPTGQTEHASDTEEPGPYTGMPVIIPNEISKETCVLVNEEPEPESVYTFLEF